MGIFGVVSYVVTRRSREIGLRMALGARGSQVMRWITKQGLTVSMAGVVIGLIVAAALTRVMSNLLFEVASVEPLTYGGVAGFLLLIAALASYLPARRATRIDPVAVLKEE
jgi:ABC-type antimicrobial peptide transport system permease subunit